MVTPAVVTFSFAVAILGSGLTPAIFAPVTLHVALVAESVEGLAGLGLAALRTPTLRRTLTGLAAQLAPHPLIWLSYN